eukprot:541919-Pelagomonas_calceolata.AAC.1
MPCSRPSLQGVKSTSWHFNESHEVLKSMASPCQGWQIQHKSGKSFTPFCPSKIAANTRHIDEIRNPLH